MKSILKKSQELPFFLSGQFKHYFAPYLKKYFFIEYACGKFKKSGL